jgi:hypothetical protein
MVGKMKYYPIQEPAAASMTTVYTIDPMSVECEIIFKEWWGTKSAKLDESSSLYKLKKIFVTKLLKTGVASQNDLDIRNVCPHVNLIISPNEIKNSSTITQARFDLLQNSKIILTPESLIINENYVEIPLQDNLFMTMFYKRGLGDLENNLPLTQLWTESLKKLSSNKFSC